MREDVWHVVLVLCNIVWWLLGNDAVNSESEEKSNKCGL